MPASPPPCAIDANVIFDLHRGGVLAIGLGAIDCIVADFVLAECEQPTATSVRSAGAREAHFGPRELVEIQRIRAREPELTVADVSTYLAARREDATVLTRDEPLDRFASDEGLDTRDTIWLVDQLVDGSQLAPARAVDAVEKMLARDRPIPRDRARAAIDRWRD